MEPAYSHQEQTQQHQMLEHANYSLLVHKQTKIKLHAIQRVHHATSPQHPQMELHHVLLIIAPQKQVDLHAKLCQTLIYPNIRYVY